MSGRAIRETLGFLGVVASLAFVGLEIRQNTMVARAQARQVLADASVSLFNALAADTEIYAGYRAWLDAGEDDVLDCYQTRMCIFIVGAARHHENVFLQVREGIVDEEVFLSYGFTNNPLYESPYFAQIWPRLKPIFHPDFVAALEAEYDLAP